MDKDDLITLAEKHETVAVRCAKESLLTGDDAYYKLITAQAANHFAIARGLRSIARGKAKP